MLIKMKRINGEETVEFVAFNFDGEGSSLALINGSSIAVFSKEETLDILLGENAKNPQYELVL